MSRGPFIGAIYSIRIIIVISQLPPFASDGIIISHVRPGTSTGSGDKISVDTVK